MICDNCDRTIDPNSTKCPYCHVPSVPPVSQFDQLILSGKRSQDEKKFANAIRSFNEAIKLESRSPLAHVSRGDTCIAAAYIYESPRYDFGDEEEEELELLQRELELLVGAAIAIGINLIGDSSDSDLVKLAINDYNTALALDPECAWAYSQRGLAYGWQDKYERAIEDYNKSLSLDPENVGFYGGRGNIYRYQLQYERAIQDYDKALSLEPESDWAYASRGEAYIGLNQIERGMQDYDKALSLNPESADTYLRKAVFYQARGQRLEAMKHYDKALTLDPEDYQLQSMREDLTCDVCDELIDDPSDETDVGSCACCENEAHYLCLEECEGCGQNYYCPIYDQSAQFPGHGCKNFDYNCHRHHCTNCGENYCTQCVGLHACIECGELTCDSCTKSCDVCAEGPYCDWEKPGSCTVCDLMWCFRNYNDDCASQMSECGYEYCQGMYPCGHHPDDKEDHCVDANTKTA